jgi:hypothetical protein
VVSKANSSINIRKKHVLVQPCFHGFPFIIKIHRYLIDYFDGLCTIPPHTEHR